MFNDLKLPDPNSLNGSAQEYPLVVLEALKDKIDAAYLNRIVAIITTTTAFNEGKEKVAGYAFYLGFLSKNDFSYRLFEVMCKNPDGGYPVQITAFSGP